MNNKLIHTLIEQRIGEYANRIALSGYGLRLTYEALNSYANQLSHGLLSFDCGHESTVGVYAGGGPLQVVALLACFKAGAVYVPMSADQAAQQLLQVMEDTGMKAIITTATHVAGLQQFLTRHGVKVATLMVIDNPAAAVLPLTVYHQDQKEHPVFSTSNVDLSYSEFNSAYVFYTSGSTGRSKGIIGSHTSLSHYIHWHQREWGIDGSFRISQLAPMTFDASLKDILTGLIGGATICMPESNIKNNPALLVEWLRSEEITLLQTVPSVFRLITGSLQESGQPFTALRYVVLAGERLYGRDVLNWKAANGTAARLSNLYGLTETTILKTCFHIDHWDWQAGEVLPVGLPVSNTMIAVVNNNSLCISGEIGEVYIKSPFISKGYTDPLLNEHHLVQNPLESNETDLVWRTGDLGRYRSDGNLEILGRRDEQVKINGVRIELEHVRSVLLQQKGIMRAELVVHTTEDFQQDLICYYTGDRYMPEQLRALLAADLNPSLLPVYYVWMDSFPLNMNGKVDKKALPKPMEILLKAGHEEPRPGLEEQLANVWRSVLGVSVIGREDNFFNAGGSSLKAIQVVTRVYKELDVQLTIADIFGNPVLRKLAEFIGQKHIDAYSAIPRAGERDSYPLSNSQKRLWLLSQLPEQSVAYNIVPVYKIRGMLDIAALAGAFQRLFERHESLRTVFFLQGEELLQRILPVDASGTGLVVRSFTGTNTEAQAYEQAARIAAEPFDLTNGPLFRTELLKIAKKEYLLILSIHHIISDEWSMGVMLREIINSYNALSEGNEPKFEALPIQYKDYAVWQQSALSEQLFSHHRQYWLKQFEGDLPVLDLPLDYTRSTEKLHQGAVLRSCFVENDSQAFQQLLQEKELTPFIGLSALVNILLYRYTGQSDLITGTPVAGRDHPDLENQIGYYLNTLALRNHITGEDSFMEVLERVKATIINAYAHQSYPFDLLVEELGLGRDPGRSPLFDVMVVWQNGQQAETLPDLDDLEIENVHLHDVVSKFDLTFFFEINKGIIDFQIEYDTALFRKERIEQMAAHLKELLHTVLQTPMAAVKVLQYIPATEQHLVLHTFNNTNFDWQLNPPDLVSCFAKQVSLNPNKTALIRDGKILSFRELNALSNQLADRLRKAHGVKRNQLIGISTARNEFLMIGILGILKAGGAYVPLDPVYPADRLNYIIEDSKLDLVLTDDATQLFNNTEVLDLSGEDVLSGYDPVDMPVLPEPADIAYVIYTSGSTGRPKGVILQHHAVINYISWANNYYFKPGKTYVFPVFTSISFDLTVTSLLGGLYRGDAVRLYPQTNLLDALDLMFREPGINALKITPAHIELLHSIGADLRDLEVIIVGGEELTSSHIARLSGMTSSDVRIFNEYGPTEATVGCVVAPVNVSADVRVIGTPIANMKIYILDEHQQLLPPGVPGELCIAGEGLAKGYLHNDVLTDERFISNPYGEGRLYRTGDIAGWTSTGEIIFYGRRDNQVKIRGYRIELGEIEESLISSGLLSQVVAAVYDAGTAKSVVAYYTADKPVAVDTLRIHLQGRLPQYMIPTHFMQLEQFSLTTNGKIDRMSLPAPLSRSKAYRAAGTATEKSIARIWEEVLGKERISLDDDFFEIGGHSLTAIQVNHRIARELSVKLNLRDIFTCSVLSQLVALVEASRQTFAGSIPRIAKQPDYELSHAQRRLWVINQLEDQSVAYNISMHYRLNGDVDLAALRAAFRYLVARHESLRTTFILEKGAPRQRILEAEECGIDLVFHDFSSFTSPVDYAIAHAADICEKVFDLEQGPLFRVELLRESPDSHLLVCCMHHIISDEWSVQVLVKEVISCYNSYVAGSVPTLAELPVQYKDYAGWQQQELAKKSFSQDRQYWLSLFEGELPVLELPADYPRPAVQKHRGALLRSNFTPEQSRMFRQIIQDKQVTPFMGILSLVAILLYRYSGQQDIIIGTPVTGRDHPDLEDQIGYYLNTLALRYQLEERDSFIHVLDQVRSTTIDAFSHQAYPFDLLIEELGVRRDMSRSPLFDVMVVWQKSEEGEEGADMKGLTGENLPVQQEVSKFDLTFFFVLVDGRMNFRIEYDTDIYSRARIERMATHMQCLLEEILQAPEKAIGHLNYIPEAEQVQLLKVFNETSKAWDLNRQDLVSCFVQQASLHPDETALVSGGKTFSFRELDSLSNQLADRLVGVHGITGNELIGISTARNEYLVIGILGILKSGAGYVPLDPTHPADRLEYIIADSQLRLILTDNTTLSYEGRVAVLNLSEESTLNGYNAAGVAVKIHPEDIAYVIYTSGSTGRPKGVLVPHKGVVNVLCYIKEKLGVSMADRLVAITTYTFDMSVVELLLPLTMGCRLILAGNDVCNMPDQLSALLNSSEAT
ncbi:non-ribosomal peptide synthetase, partial [Chitinophaga sancti]